MSQKARGDDLGIVDDQNVAGMKIILDVVKMPMRICVFRAVEHEKSGFVALFRRILRDQLLGQIVIVIG